jgi:hypothetical protein
MNNRGRGQSHPDPELPVDTFTAPQKPRASITPLQFPRYFQSLYATSLQHADLFPSISVTTLAL